MNRAEHHPAQSNQALGALEPLLAPLAALVAELLAPLLAAELNRQPATAGPPTRRLLTLDELIALLPNGKKRSTWKAWLYQRTRLGQVPGCHKIGGRLFFDRDLTLAWFAEGAADTAGNDPALDLSAHQSLHGEHVRKRPPHRPQRRRA